MVWQHRLNGFAIQIEHRLNGFVIQIEFHNTD